MRDRGTYSITFDIGGPFWGLPKAGLVRGEGDWVVFVGWLYFAIAVTFTPAGDDE